jgi:RimJ/RimL family protein N-acetyltransferase
VTDNDKLSVELTGIRAGGGDASAAQETLSGGEAIVQEAIRAREERRYDDALRHLLAAFARVVSSDRSRQISDFLPMLEWGFLAEEYAPARAALVEARDVQVHRLLAGELTYGLPRSEWSGPRSRFWLIVDMNETLRDPHSTATVFARLEALFPARARSDAFLALPALVEAGDFALAERYLPDPLGALARLNETAQSSPLFPPPRTAVRLSAELSNFAKEVRLRTAILGGLGRGPEAEALLDAALAGLANDELREWVGRDLRRPGAILRESSERQMEEDRAANPHWFPDMPAPQALETERLLLRPFTIDDAEAWLPLISLPDIIRYTGDTPAGSVDEARELLRSRPLKDYTRYGFGRLAVIEKASGRLVGFCGFKYVAELGEVDIGYRFLTDCWGKGYATESAAALMTEGRRALHLRRVVGTVHPDNPASGRVLEKLGLRFERVLEPDEDGVRFLLYATPGSE